MTSNNSPEQKQAWEDSKHLGSRFIKVQPSRCRRPFGSRRSPALHGRSRIRGGIQVRYRAKPKSRKQGPFAVRVLRSLAGRWRP